MSRTTADFDLTYRPDYWRPSDPISTIIANVKGEARRQMILDVLERRHLLTCPGAELPQEMLADTLSDQDRTAWGRFHPHFMVDGCETAFVFHPAVAARGSAEVAR